ncbi:MAG: hypothetical protein ABI718_00020 [Acidobacteriota bacterium]
MNDVDLLNDSRVIQQFCVPEDYASLREAAHILARAYTDFDYEKSIEFEQIVAGKSEAYARMKASIFSDPTKRKEQQERFKEALKSLLESDAALNLVPRQERYPLLKVRELILELQNPTDPNSTK